MTGFDNGTLQGGVFFQAKQFGSILRGFGPPVPQAGVVGDLYMDTQTFFLFNKRSAAAGDDKDPWGNYLFQVPEVYRNALKYFSAAPPTNDIGVPGDYCLLWAGFANYGMQPSIYGPKQVSGWPENGVGVDLVIDPESIGYALQVGLLGEGDPTPYSNSTQLVVAGLTDEYILSIPAAPVANMPVSQTGLQSQPLNITILLNPIFGANAEHAV